MIHSFQKQSSALKPLTCSKQHLERYSLYYKHIAVAFYALVKLISEARFPLLNIAIYTGVDLYSPM